MQGMNGFAVGYGQVKVGRSAYDRPEFLGIADGNRSYSGALKACMKQADTMVASGRQRRLRWVN